MKKFLFVIKITSHKYDTTCSRHSFKRELQFLSTARHVISSMAAISCRIFSFSWTWEAGLLLYTLVSRYPLEEKSIGIKSRLRGDQFISLLLELNFWGKISWTRGRHVRSEWCCSSLLCYLNKTSRTLQFIYQEVFQHLYIIV